MRYLLFILAVALLICLLPMPYGYYILIRYFAAVVFTIIAYEAYKKEESKNQKALFYFVMAILFQPFIKLPLGRTLWNIVDVISAIILFIQWWIYKEKDKNR